MINWSDIISSLSTTEGVCVSFNNVENIPVGAIGFNEIINNFKKENYDFSTI